MNVFIALKGTHFWSLLLILKVWTEFILFIVWIVFFFFFKKKHFLLVSLTVLFLRAGMLFQVSAVWCDLDRLIGLCCLLYELCENCFCTILSIVCYLFLLKMNFVVVNPSKRNRCIDPMKFSVARWLSNGPKYAFTSEVVTQIITSCLKQSETIVGK